MLGLPLTFAAPAVLAALALLAALYIFLRVTPPRPRPEIFPPLRLLLGLMPEDSTPARTPWPILILRMAVAAALVGAMAGPLWNAASAALHGQGALVLLIDDGWPAAPSWDKRIRFAGEKIAEAARAGRLVAIAPISAGALEVAPLEPAQAAEKLRALAPQPFAPGHAGAREAIEGFWKKDPKAEVLWIADGLELGAAGALAQALGAQSQAHAVSVATGGAEAVAVTSAENGAAGLVAHAARASAGGPSRRSLRALDAKGRTIAAEDFDFGSADAADVRFDLPVELRNDVASVIVAGEASAGAVFLADARWRRRRVAIYSGGSADTAQPLLAPDYYLSRALSPFAEIRQARGGASDPIKSLLEGKPSAFLLADAVLGPGDAHDALAKFVDEGGVLLRFAGTRLAATADDLTPAPLRRGGRTLGGALSWDTPKHVAPFEKDSPFFGLAAPDEVTISRQVLAEPDAALAGKIWARLADGTPLVTAARRGKGLIVLFHVTADTTWSNLPISGLFVDMLRRVVEQAGAAAPAEGAAGKDAELRPPYRTLNGFGALGEPPASATPIPADFAGPGDAAHPPGFYGDATSAMAVNATVPGQILTPADYGALSVAAKTLEISPPLDLRPWLLSLALIGFLADGLAQLLLGGAFGRGLRRAGAVVVALALLMPGAGGRQALAAGAAGDKAAALQTHLAYVVTGDASVDETSRAGLATLSAVLAQRTSASPGDPVGVDPARDELSFYPLIYWPVVASRPKPSSAAIARVAAFMQNGGTMLFDTRDALNDRPGGPPTPEAQWLRQMLAGVDVPELAPVPSDHVVTKSFYLVDGFVGRTDMGQTWIEALPAADPADRQTRPVRAGDGVSPIIIASNDLAAAWATDAGGRPLYPLIPGGARQREMALRGGVNLVMYALTGNYKADQVHAKDLLERLSR